MYGLLKLTARAVLHRYQL